MSVINLSSIFFFRQDIVSRQHIVKLSSTYRQSSIVNSSSAGRKIYLFCAVLRLFPGIGVALCYLCMRDALRKVLHFLGFKLFLKFLKKNFAIRKTSVYLHSTNKQNDKMQNVSKIEILTALAIFMGALMLAGLFLCNIYLIAISEFLAVLIIGFRFFLTSKNK